MVRGWWVCTIFATKRYDILEGVGYQADAVTQHKKYISLNFFAQYSFSSRVILVNLKLSATVFLSF